MSATFTPGPWKALIHETLEDAREDSGFTWLRGEQQAAKFLPLGCVWKDTGSGLTGLPGHVETTAANARLIAAAPELYDVAVDTLDAFNRLRDGFELSPRNTVRDAALKMIDQHIDMLEAALFKARGAA